MRAGKQEIIRDRKGIRSLHARFKRSSLWKAVDKAMVDDDTFNDLLQEILGDEETTVAKIKAKKGAAFAEFDKAIEELADAEESSISSRHAGFQSESRARISGSVRRHRVSGASLAAASGSVLRQGISGFAFVSGAAFDRHNPCGLTVSGSIAIGDLVRYEGCAPGPDESQGAF